MSHMNLERNVVVKSYIIVSLVSGYQDRTRGFLKFVPSYKGISTIQKYTMMTYTEALGHHIGYKRIQ